MILSECQSSCRPLDSEVVANAIIHSSTTVGRAADPYGEGTASKKIAGVLAAE